MYFPGSSVFPLFCGWLSALQTRESKGHFEAPGFLIADLDI